MNGEPGGFYIIVILREGAKAVVFLQKCDLALEAKHGIAVMRDRVRGKRRK